MEVGFDSSGLYEEDTVEVDDSDDNEDFEVERCGICKDATVDRGVLDCCQHWFCFDCIDNWATIANLCPLCQNEFQLITCVPVYDVSGHHKVDKHLFPRDDDWSIEGRSSTISFPSYYIDENAVMCLTGNDCKIRSGSDIAEDANLDTSIACDSCDIWYHAFCVGFDPSSTTEDSWLCPRCIADEVADNPNGALMEQLSSNCELDGSCSPNLAERMFSGEVSVSLADAGETAVVVSLVGANKLVSETSENLVDGKAHSDEHIDGDSFSAELETNSSHHAPPSQPLDYLIPSALKGSDGENMNELVSPNFIASSSLKGTNDSDSGHLLIESPMSNTGIEAEMGGTTGELLLEGPLNNSEMNVEMVGASDEHLQGGPMMNTRMDVKMGGATDELLLGVEIHDTNTNEDAIDVIDAKRKHANCSNDNNENEDAICLKKVRTKEKIQVVAAKGQPDTHIPSKKVVSSDYKAEQPRKKHQPCGERREVLQETGLRPCKELARQGSAHKSSPDRLTPAGLRVKKIIRRTQEDKQASFLIHKLKNEIRDALRPHSHSPANNKENDGLDPKLFAAFCSAIRPTNVPKSKALPVRKTNKFILQKGRIRESLTRKIYGRANGRRSSRWVRDCEIEFWKHRCGRVEKPARVDTLQSVLDLLRNDVQFSEAETEPGSQVNPILSRLYLADASVLPRKGDIVPLSAFEPPCDSKKKREESVSLEILKNPQTGPNHSLSEANLLIRPPASPAVGGGAQGDKKVDKRKWALEVLARKTSNVGTDAMQASKEGNAGKATFPLIAKLPMDMRPQLAPSRHNKISLSVRQAQLYRLAENFLRKLDLPEICRTAETELAIADATNIEKAVADKSNSKSVYLNLCSQEILHRSDKSKATTTTRSTPLIVGEEAPPSNPDVEDALRDCGLLFDSPPRSPSCHVTIPDPSAPILPQAVDNVFEMDSVPDVDIFGDFEYDLEDEFLVGATSAQASRPLMEQGDPRMKVIFSTLKSERSNFVHDNEDEGFLGHKNCPSDHASSPKVEAAGSVVKSVADAVITIEEGGGGGALLVEDDREPSLMECEELYGPDKEPLEERLPEEMLKELHLPEVTNSSAEQNKNVADVDTVFIAENKVDGDDETPEQSQGENVTVVDTNFAAQNNAVMSDDGESSSNGVRVHVELLRKNLSKTSKGDHVNSIQAKVEAYIKEHIRPLCRSHVITADQYRWAVAKATSKVMKYHGSAKNANFLIREGDKVKKLAEEYVHSSNLRRRK